ncbi:MAG: hypothetical protein OXC91_01785 [Rhodobacteraceae bacterium]|nr:hypothetical protein [Paracoccaceae bacterium]
MTARSAASLVALVLILAACSETDDVPVPPPPLITTVSTLSCGTDTACQEQERQIRATTTAAGLDALRAAVDTSSLDAVRKAGLVDLIDAARTWIMKRAARAEALDDHDGDACTADEACGALLVRIRRAGNITALTAIEGDVASDADLSEGLREGLTDLIAELKPAFTGIAVRNHDGGFVAMADVEAALDGLARQGPDDARANYLGDGPDDASGQYGVWLDDTAEPATLTLWYQEPEGHASVTALPAETYTGRATYRYVDNDAEGHARRGGYSGAFTARTTLTLDLGRGADDQRIDGTLDRFAFRASGLTGDTPPGLADWNGVRLEWRGAAGPPIAGSYSVSRGLSAADTLDVGDAGSTWHVRLHHDAETEEPVVPAGMIGYFDLHFTGEDAGDRAVGVFAAPRSP